MAGNTFPALNVTQRICGVNGENFTSTTCCSADSSTLSFPNLGSYSYCSTSLTLSQFQECTNSSYVFCQNAQSPETANGSSLSFAPVIRPPKAIGFSRFLIAVLLLTAMPMFAFAAVCTSFTYSTSFTTAPMSMQVTSYQAPPASAEYMVFATDQANSFAPWISPVNVTSWDIYGLARRSVPEAESASVEGFVFSSAPVHLNAEVVVRVPAGSSGDSRLYMTFAPTYVCINGTVDGCDSDAQVVSGTDVQVCTLQRIAGGNYGTYLIAARN